MKYRNTSLHGLLVVDKPGGVTSMDVVRSVRRAAGHCKTGHAGTLDPLATGVLICLLGRATKATDTLMALAKTYETTVDLSAFTATDDAEGERQPVSVEQPPQREQVERVLAAMTGEIEQTPPAHSAVKIDGQRAYKLARQGREAEIPSRIVRIDAIELLAYDWPRLTLRVGCGKGTYIRSLGRDIGLRLGTGGYLADLRRTAIGPYTIDRAIPLDRLPEPITQDHLSPVPEHQKT